MGSHTILLVAFVIIGVSTALNVLNVVQILPKHVITEIPSRLSSKVSQMMRDDDSLQTSYTFPEEYKTTLYKDHDKLTTLVNVFPKVETKTPTLKFQTLGYQILQTSTTQLYEIMNSTLLYQTTPMLNSTLVYPTTVPVQSIGYATLEFMHETHVYPTRINITEVTSTTLANYTKILHVDNHLPLV